MAISRSTASAFPLDTAGSGGAHNSISGVVLGSEGDLIVVSIGITGDFPSSGVAASPANGLVFTKAIQYYNPTTYEVDVEIWTAPITAAAAGTTVKITQTPSGGTGYNELVVDELNSGLGTSTIWLVGNSGETFSDTSVTVAALADLMSGAGALQAYYGYWYPSSSATGGTSPVNGVAFTYSITSANASGIAFGPGLAASTAYTPDGAQASGKYAAVAAIFAPTTAVTGTASVTLGALSVTATGKRTTFGSGAVTLGALSLTATSQRTTFGSATVSLGALSLTATGTSATTVTGTATVTIGALSVSAVGQRTTFATASIDLGALAIEATGVRTTFGVATVDLGAFVVSVTTSQPQPPGTVELAITAQSTVVLSAPAIGATVALTVGPIGSVSLTASQEA